MSMFTLTANRTTALLVLGCVAIFGFVLGIRHGSGGAVPAAAPTQPAWAGTLTLEYPRGWRPVRNGPTLPGLTFTNPLVLVPGGQHHATGLIAGRLANSQSSPLPAALLKTLVAAPRAEVVEATNGQAYRYRLSDYPSRGDSLELYVVPGLDEDATALACYASAGQSAYLGACRQIVSTLRLSGAGTEKLTPDPAIRASTGLRVRPGTGAGEAARGAGERLQLSLDHPPRGGALATLQRRRGRSRARDGSAGCAHGGPDGPLPGAARSRPRLPRARGRSRLGGAVAL